MRISELLAATVIDETGEVGGRVRDVRFTRRTTGENETHRFEVSGLVIGGGLLVHRLGFAENRASGPRLLRLLTGRRATEARFIPVQSVHQWGPDIIKVSGRLKDLPRLLDVLDQ